MFSTSLLLVTALGCFGFLLVGYDNGVMGGIIGAPAFNKTFNKPDANVVSTIVSIYEIGCFAGAVITSFFGDVIGRRKTIGIGAIIMIGGAVGQAASSSTGPMIASRIISGLGMGAINSTCPVILSESAPQASRGRFVAAQLSVLNLGIFLAYWTGYGFDGKSESSAWRIPVALQGAFLIPILLLCFIVPESSRWLMSKGKKEEALASVARIQGKDKSHPDVLAQYADIEQAVEYERAVGSGSWSALLHDDEMKHRKRFLIACSIQAFQQLGGINGIIYYAGYFIGATGLSSSGVSLVVGLLFTWFFIASFIPWFLIDSLGRRPLLLVCISLMAACFAAETGLIWKVEKDSSRNAGIAATAVFFVYMGLFTTGFQAVVWVYPSEILSMQYRQKGASISTACNWIVNFAIVKMTPPALENIGWKFYIIFMILNALFVPIIYFFYPETKGLALEQVDRLFNPLLAAQEPNARESEPATASRDYKGDEVEQIEKLSA